MKRVVKKPEVRKQELISIALHQFIQNGYEKTSVRSILKEANGEIGMFYYYFESKNDIFEAALDYYNEIFIEKLKESIDINQSILQQFDSILVNTFASIDKYRQFNKEASSETILILHASTLDKLVPIFKDNLKQNEPSLSSYKDEDLMSIVRFLLYGISGIIHNKDIDDINIKKQQVKQVCKLVLNGIENKIQ
ncbi:TetR/AcrR family transcriptional regulator [Breznakia pachnodae]|uniref:AcrR family transcriptional regulator n=1 Tax=Breznakia pachnodae TaxID=265178 RepID=A0ABU0E1Q5_9FIRM|nr:TetR/AcrR family transcriptional regulator [Breznakia pachnodae]MDQ0360822.1 AcrR family transcriptional regulator [Breznakia pachnodae]